MCLCHCRWPVLSEIAAGSSETRSDVPRREPCAGESKEKMTREIIQTDGAPNSPAYSQAVKSGGFVFVSGQGPFDPVSGDVVGESIQEQTRQCLTNIEAILTAAGSSLDKVVSATFILDEESDFAGMNEEWVEVVSHRPTRAAGRQTADSPQGHEDFHCRDRRSLTIHLGREPEAPLAPFQEVVGRDCAGRGLAVERERDVAMGDEVALACWGVSAPQSSQRRA